jgi:hypothetical protein
MAHYNKEEIWILAPGTLNRHGGTGMHGASQLIFATVLCIFLNTAAAAPISCNAEIPGTSSQSADLIRIAGELDTAYSSMTVAPFAFHRLQMNSRSVETPGTGTFTQQYGPGWTFSTATSPGRARA